jgi:hypothetical protein
MFATGNLMELEMKIRHLLVAASAAAILAGSSYGALAGGWNYSKGESSSGVLSVGVYISGVPIAATLQGQHNKSVVVGNGWNGAAGAEAGTDGGATAGKTYASSSSTGTPPVAAPGYAPIAGTAGTSAHSGSTYATANGSTSGSSCAGNAC